MKFLCGNCKAKYQIADEKASGKTLRMKCRRCGHDILIDGHNMPASSVPPAPPGARRTSSSLAPSHARAGAMSAPLPGRLPGVPGGLARPSASRSKPPSALGAEFRRHMAAPPEVPQRSAPYDLWHAAIQDVPVGPMTRDELARKIETGAVTAESLCWREGMDDWRPLGELPELAQLLRRSREGSWSGRPPPRHRPPPHMPAPPSRPAPHFAIGEEPEEEHSEPTRIADLSHPLPAAQAGGTSPKIAAPPPSVQPAPTLESPAVPAQGRQPASGWTGMTTGLAVGLLAGIVLVGGPVLYKTFWSGSAPAVTPQPAAEASAAQRETQAPAAQDIELNVPEQPEDKPEETVTPKTTKPASQNVRGGKTAGKEAAGKELSAEEKALLARMGASSEVDLNTAGRPKRTDNSGASSGPSLNATQLSKVVQDNKVQLQRCYETALRAAGGRQDGAIKVTVNVTVGMSGTIKSVTTQGAGLGNMNDCIRSAVKRWRFPQSGGESEFAFPLVFQPGA